MTALYELISGEISAGGPMPFARFMELALYAPGLGYYERAPNQIGRKGDFYTSVSVGPFFGELLAFQFDEWLKAMGRAALPRRHLVECGAHNGQLAADILGALRANHPDTAAEVEYWIVEPSPVRRAVQQSSLAEFTNVRWIEDISALSGIVGVIFSNELLDAMPLHVFAWNAESRCWEERGVTIHEGKLAWTSLPAPSIDPPQLPAALLDVLPDGYTVERSPKALQWWKEAAMALAQGKLMTIDYGGTFEELMNPGRLHGTLRAYSRHHHASDVLANPGKQDLTAHVNFTDIQQIGEQAGLATETFANQSQFLTSIARELWTAKGSWPPVEVRQFQTLTHPEHLGRPFRVLV